MVCTCFLLAFFSDQMKEHRDIDFAKKTGFLQCGRSSNSNSPPVARQRSSSLLYNYTPSNSTFLDPPESISQPTSRSAQPFLHSSRQIVPIFCNGPTFPLKIVLYMGSGPPSNACFLVSIRVHNPNGMHLDLFSRF